MNTKLYYCAANENIELQLNKRSNKRALKCQPISGAALLGRPLIAPFEIQMTTQLMIGCARKRWRFYSFFLTFALIINYLKYNAAIEILKIIESFNNIRAVR